MTNTSRILIIDDEPGTTEFVSRLLEKHGYEVTVKESGEDAVKFLNGDQQFDLVLMDYLMVGLNGIETLEVLKKQPHTSHLKVVILSGLSDVEDVEKAMIDIIYAHSGKSAPESEAYWNELKEAGIYKADVY